MYFFQICYNNFFLKVLDTSFYLEKVDWGECKNFKQNNARLVMET